MTQQRQLQHKDGPALSEHQVPPPSQESPTPVSAGPPTADTNTSSSDVPAACNGPAADAPAAGGAAPESPAAAPPPPPPDEPAASAAALWQIAMAVTTPHPKSRLATGELRADRSREGKRWYERCQKIWSQSKRDGQEVWPPIGPPGIERRVHDYESAVWSQVEDGIAREGFDLERIQSQLTAARQDVLGVSHRLHVDAVRMTRFVRQAELGSDEQPMAPPRLPPPPPPWPLYAVAAVAILAAFVAGASGASLWVPLALVLVSIGALIAAALQPSPPRPTPPPLREPPPLPFDLDLIDDAKRCIAELAIRISRALEVVRVFKQNYDEAVEAAATARPASDALHDAVANVELDRLVAVASSEEEEAVEQYSRALAEFPARIVCAFRGEESVEAILQWLDGEFRRQYRFLYRWDLGRFMQATRGETFEQWEQQWSATLATAWEMQDDQCEESLCVTLELGGDARGLKGRRTAERAVRLYKLNHGLLAAGSPAWQS